MIFVQTDLSNLRWDDLRIPRTVEDVRQLAALISEYRDDNYYAVLGTFIGAYILLQSTCLPGSLMLSILAGYLFPAPLALVIICTCSTLGSAIFYTLVNRHRTFILKLFRSDKVERFNEFVQAQIQKHQSNLFLIVFLLRATPVFPNWSINLFSPIINLPLKPFMLGTFTGIAPLSVIHIYTGRVLNELSSQHSLVSWTSVGGTSAVAVAIVTIIWAMRKV